MILIFLTHHLSSFVRYISGSVASASGKVEAINTDADRQEGRDLQDGSFSFPSSIIPNDGIINGVDATDDVEAVPEDNTDQESIQQLEEKPLDDGILTLMNGKLVDKLKNGKVDEVSSLVKEVVARGIDDEGIGQILVELITLLVDLSWDENKKSISSKSGKSSKKSSDGRGKSSKKSMGATQAPPVTTTFGCPSLPGGIGSGSGTVAGLLACTKDSDCFDCKLLLLLSPPSFESSFLFHLADTCIIFVLFYQY